MGLRISRMLEKLKVWCTEQWKAVVAFLGLAAAAAAMYLRSKDQKKILDYTNKSHKEEAEANKEAEKKLVDGLDTISKEKDVALEETEKAHVEKQKDLSLRKKDLIEKAAKDENLESLAKDLADQIGADFVK